MRAVDVDPVDDTRACFRALVDATSRPGTVQSVPVAPADRTVIATLVDHEVSIRTTDDTLREALAAEGRLTAADLADADVVHVRGSTEGRVREARRGSLKEPSDGATVVYRVEALEALEAEDSADTPPTDGPGGSDGPGGADGADASDDADDRVRLRLAGPGVPGVRTLGVRGLPVPEFAAIRDAQSTFPRGVDVFLAAGRRVAALPRTVDLAVDAVGAEVA